MNRTSVPGLVSVIVRFASGQRVDLLTKAIQSLRAQSCKQIEVVLVHSGYSADEILPSSLIPPTGQYIFYIVSKPADTRTTSLNRGTAAATGQYVAFLDYDDVWYPSAVQAMLARFTAVTAGVVVFGVDLVTLASEGEIDRRGYSSQKKGILDLCEDNFIPIHSFLLDRTRILQMPVIPEEVVRCEDYFFLLELVKLTQFDFENSLTSVGEYRIRLDGTNTVSLLGADRESKEWLIADRAIQLLKSQVQVKVSAQEAAEFALRKALPGKLAILKNRWKRKMKKQMIARVPWLLKRLLLLVRYRRLTT